MDAAEVARVRGRLWGLGRQVHLFPIRHHSPSCALQLTRGLREIGPKAILIELPIDFSPLIPQLLDPALRLPVAIVAIPGGNRRERPSPAAYWPISATSPEYAAIRAAGACGASIGFIDLPSDAIGPARGEAAPGAPLFPTDGRPGDPSPYMRALAARAGCRDAHELWDRLFEARIAEPDWRGFFADVGAFCAFDRRSAGTEAGDGPDRRARERHMRARIAATAATTDGPIAVVTGGAHAGALLDPTKPIEPPVATAGRSRSWLVRYSHRRLDALGGYDAGMPSPRYYERLFAAAERGEADPFLACAQETLLDLAAHLRVELPGFAPGAPGIVETLRHAAALAELRGLPGPLRAEMMDSARAALAKDEDPRAGSPLLEALAIRMTGVGIGETPQGAAAPPLVEAARRDARALGFSVTDSAMRRRELDIHRNARHREASRFAHAMAILGAEFARLERGADPAIGVDLDALFEIWTYAWSPVVEARLIEAGADGDDVASACAAALRRRAARLSEDGRGRNAAAAADLVLAAARAGLPPSLLEDLLRRLEADIGEDPDLGRVAAAVRTLVLLWRGRPTFGLGGAPGLGELLGAGYRRAVFLLATFGASAPEHGRRMAEALVSIREVVDCAGQLPAIDPDLFAEALDALIAAPLAPLLEGAVAALSVQFGSRPMTFLATRLGGALAGAAAAPEDRVAPLAGLLMVAPAALRRMAPVVVALDRALGALDEADFVQLLPHLRAAFTTLSPLEAEALGAAIAARHGLPADAIDGGAAVAIGEAELSDNLAASRAFETLWREDGLGGWLEAEPRR